MKAARQRGFTLIELLVVVTIVVVLVAMLGPLAGQAWRVTNMSRCQVNLKRIYDAFNTRRADLRAVHFVDNTTTAAEWPALLLPYLENRKEPLTCPEAENPWADFGTSLKLGDIVFEIYKSWGNYLYDIPLDSDFIFVGPGRDNPASAGWKEYQIEDQRTGGDYSSDHKDICVEIQWVSGRPVKIYFSPHHSGHSYRFKFRIKDEIIFENYNSDDSSMIGTTMDLSAFGVSTCDYGMSRGCYEVTGRTVPVPDGKLFFILDYPQSVADYMDPVGGDDWKRFFVVDPQQNPAVGTYTWQPPPGYEDFSWRQVTALRHFRKANVLFCDGHVESLGIDALDDAAYLDGRHLLATNPLWRQGG
jgi:prepilin-type N-terminal cleavage/methylation domain-containing protein/prepilin-type processing-associated H-X9-DG protein